MTCLICTRQARGFGYRDTRFRPGDPRRTARTWVFCSRACQDTFHTLYHAWRHTDPKEEDRLMVDPTEFERAAMRMCLRFFGEAASAIGFDKPLGQYTEAEALQVIEAILTAWTEEMAAHHARVNALAAERRVK